MSPWPGPPAAVSFAAVAASATLGPSLPWMFWLPIGNCGACAPSPVKAGILLGPSLGAPEAGVRGSAPSLEPP